MRIAVGSDFIGLELKTALVAALKPNPQVESLEDIGVLTQEDKRDYPDIGFALATKIAEGKADRGLLVCGTGIGMAISANKVQGIRAATTHDPYSLERAILSNNCQVICMGARVITVELAKLLIAQWLEYSFDSAGPSSAKVAKIDKFDFRNA
ncbi:MAG: RpiB/LacA/LacB family sugar-phosphate isomerase [Candidatus Nanopelagicaceae bacterium]|nr:RpiB/LacA/LacB family sugar-phosphate isomerase [Candidatus Nanopelagicaceae bacterium]